MTETPDDFFAHYFASLGGGRSPYPWQTKLFGDMVAGEWPDSLALPTGTGKTAILYVWLIALAWSLRHGQLSAIPRRLGWVVNRRVVVDQATDEAERIQEALEALPDGDPLASALSGCSFSGRPLAVSTLRGERADNRDWSRDPSTPAIVVGTVDMIGSRLLFRGYRDGRYWRPHHAGLLGVDSLIVNDESHLTPAFARLLVAIRAMCPAERVHKPFRVMLVSATERGLGTCPFAHELEQDLKSSERFQRIYEAEKRLYLHEVPDNKSLAAKLRELALQNPVARTIVFVEEPEKAADLAAQLETEVGKARVALLTGTMRGRERDALAGNPVFVAFTKPEAPASPLYLVTTSAAEVGVNISGERLVTRLLESDRLLQRLGRLNRFGDQPGEPHRAGQAHLVYVRPKETAGDDESREARTLEYLLRLPALDDGSHDVACRTLRENPPPRESASAEPATARLEGRLVDLWSQTTAIGPAIPGVASWLHGKQDNPPETEVAWREEVIWIAQDEAATKAYEDVLSPYRVLPHERLKEPALRALDKLKDIAEQQGDTRILFQAYDGQVQALTVAEAAELRLGVLAHGLLLLPPGCGSVWRGMFRAGAAERVQYDVADMGQSNESNSRRRYRAEFDGAQWHVWRLGMGEAESNEEAPENADRTRLVEFARRRQLGAPLKIPLPTESEDQERCLIFFPARAGRLAANLGPVDLDPHCQDVARCAAALSRKLGLNELEHVIEAAGRLHDCGKATGLWQRAMGGNENHPQAKTAGRAAPALLAGFRHELASVLNAPPQCSSDDLVLHLIGSHHGWARPFWEAKAYDRQRPGDSQEAALEAARRFGRLQRAWGPWGLAWLEALVKAADGWVSGGGAYE